MGTQTAPPAGQKKYQPYVPENMEMKEFTFRAVLIGLVMTAILGSANAYLGLKAGMTIAATYPAAVIGMALLRLMKGAAGGEHCPNRQLDRRVGSRRSSLHDPRLVMADYGRRRATSTGSQLRYDDRRHPGILFVTLLRRGRGSRPSLSGVGGSREIHKAGQRERRQRILSPTWLARSCSF
jgi:hypothetical protein